MTTTYRYIFIICLIFSTISCTDNMNSQELRRSIQQELSAVKGDFAVAFKDISSGQTVLLNEKEKFHAASTMKTPVMIEIFRQVASGQLSLDDTIVLKNEFKSIVDGSPYSLSPEDDSEKELYRHLGEKRTIAALLYDMIIVSSNLATNLIIEKAGANNVMQTMHALGANDIRVLRGVEDSKAFEKGLNNTTTAYDQLLLYEKLAEGKAIDPESDQRMIDILLNQRFNEVIPAELPAEVRVAHKTGSITGVQHDAGIVMLPDGRKYILVLLSKNLEDEKAGIQAMAKVSGLIYDYVLKNTTAAAHPE